MNDTASGFFILHGVGRAPDGSRPAPEGVRPRRPARGRPRAFPTPMDVLEREPVRLLDLSEFIAVASWIPDPLPEGGDARALLQDPAQAQTLALGHHRVLSEIARTHDIAPVRFGAALADSVAVAQAVQAQAGALEDALDRIAGAVEYAVRVSPAAPETAALTPDAAPPAPEQAGEPATGRAYLEARRAKRHARRSLAQDTHARLSRITAPLAALARAHLTQTRSDPTPAGAADVELSLLIARHDEPRLAAALAALTADAQFQGWSLRAAGPWPAYSFAQTSAQLDTTPSASTEAQAA